MIWPGDGRWPYCRVRELAWVVDAPRPPENGTTAAPGTFGTPLGERSKGKFPKSKYSLRSDGCVASRTSTLFGVATPRWSWRTVGRMAEQQSLGEWLAESGIRDLMFEDERTVVGRHAE